LAFRHFCSSFSFDYCERSTAIFFFFLEFIVRAPLDGICKQFIDRENNELQASIEMERMFEGRRRGG
jgi:hypothetical protein